MLLENLTIYFFISFSTPPPTPLHYNLDLTYSSAHSPKMAATNVHSTAGPQDCTLYYYLWPCGHMRRVKCTKCSLNDPSNIEGELF